MIYSQHYNRNNKTPRLYSPWLARAASAIVIILTVAYIGLTNDIATQGYKLKTLQQETKRLEQANAEINIEVAAAQSLQRLESVSASLALTPLEHIEYLTTSATAVAVR